MVANRSELLVCTSRIFAGQNPIHALPGNIPQPQKNFEGGRALSKLVFRELRLADSELPPELTLSQVDAAYLANAPADGPQVRASFFIPIAGIHSSGIIFLLGIMGLSSQEGGSQ
jgi:hypothetical protein